MSSILEIRNNICDWANLDLSIHTLAPNSYTIDIIKLPQLGKRKRTSDNLEESIIKIQQILKDQPRILASLETIDRLLTLCHHISQHSSDKIKALEDVKLFILQYQLIYNKQFNKLPTKIALDQLKNSLLQEAKEELADPLLIQRLENTLNDIVISPDDLSRALHYHITDQDLSAITGKLARKIILAAA